MKILLGQFVRFGIVGLSGAAVNIALFNLLILIKFFDQYYLLAATIGFIASAINNFAWNRHWTFKVKHKALFAHFLHYLAVAVIGLVMNLCIMRIFIEEFGLNKTMANIVAIAFVSIFNFALNRLWVFKSA